MSGSEAPSRRRKRARLLGWLAFGVVAQTLAVLGYGWVERGRRQAREPFAYERLGGDALPAAVLERPDRSLVRTESLRGRPVLLHFWATWCPPCRTELPSLLALERTRPIGVVALTLDPEWSRLTSYFGGRIPKQVVREPGGGLKRAFRVDTLPETYLLDARGIPRLRFRGARDWTSRAALAVLDGWVRARD